jgi:hypothetical protein
MSEEAKAPDATIATPDPATRRRRRTQRVAQTSGKTWETLEDAAPRLGVTVEALRARCRRGAKDENGTVRVDLGCGAVAMKLGRSWRVCFSA